MASNEQKLSSSAPAGTKQSVSEQSSKPDWADGLKQLYDSVVEEPLPDSFTDLLSQLDDNHGGGSGGGNNSGQSDSR